MYTNIVSNIRTTTFALNRFISIVAVAARHIEAVGAVGGEEGLRMSFVVHKYTVIHSVHYTGIQWNLSIKTTY